MAKFLIAFFLVLFIWTIRNYIVLGTPIVLSTNGPINYFVVQSNWHRLNGEKYTFPDLPEGTTETSELNRLKKKLVGFYMGLSMSEWGKLLGWGLFYLAFPFYSDGTLNLTLCLLGPFALLGVYRKPSLGTLYALIAVPYVLMLIGNPYRASISPLFVLLAAYGLKK